MKYDILLFGGTSEGRRICEYAKEKGLSVYVCVTTEYGADLTKGADYISKKKLDAEEIKEILLKNSFNRIIDATHPYAKEISRNIKTVCSELNLEVIRIIRKRVLCDKGIYFEHLSEIAEYLNRDAKIILFTTGAKEIDKFSHINNFSERAYVRIIPDAGSIEKCIAAGVMRSRIICMQGPFSAEFDAALIREIKAEYIVTKESGDSGGFLNKINAAVSTGAVPLILSCKEEVGISIDELFEIM